MVALANLRGGAMDANCCTQDSDLPHLLRGDVGGGVSHLQAACGPCKLSTAVRCFADAWGVRKKRRRRVFGAQWNERASLRHQQGAQSCVPCFIHR